MSGMRFDAGVDGGLGEPKDGEERYCLNVYRTPNEPNANPDVVGPFAEEREAREAFVNGTWEPGTKIVLWLADWMDFGEDDGLRPIMHEWDEWIIDEEKSAQQLEMFRLLLDDFRVPRDGRVSGIEETPNRIALFKEFIIGLMGVGSWAEVRKAVGSK